MAEAPLPTQPPAIAPSAIQTRPRAVKITSQEVQPSMQLYLQDEDTLQLAVLANFNNAQAVFQLRILTPDGQIIPTVRTVISPVAGVFLTSAVFSLGECYLLSAAVGTPAPVGNGQWVYANITLFRGGIPFQSTYTEITAGYISSHFAMSWPEWVPQRPTDGPGTPVSFNVANPAAGTDWSVTVPTARRWQLLAARARLTTGAAVANRFAGIVHTDGTNQLYFAGQNNAIVASSTGLLVFTPGVQPFSDTQGDFLVPLPSPDILEQGYVINSFTVGLQAADQWSGIQLMLQEWAEIL